MGRLILLLVVMALSSHLEGQRWAEDRRGGLYGKPRILWTKPGTQQPLRFPTATSSLQPFGV